MQLAHLAWPEVERYLASSDAVVIPIGSTEQHGPNGLCGTDFLTADGIARAAGDAAGVLVAPPLPYGMATHHMGFAGTVTLRPSTLMAMVHDVVGSLHRHGFRGFYFMNGHGGNIATLHAAFSEVHHALAGCRFRLTSWWQNAEVRKLEKELFGEKNGRHATPSEISVTMHLAPGAVEPLGAPAVIEHPRHDWPLSAEDFRKTFPDGRMESDPSLADAGAGKRLFDLCVKLVAEDLWSFTSGGRAADAQDRDAH
ncbi:MAG: creatininase family protein [Deltaproteobacteria bacterium]|nr:creatininase family protein [Deltaproteobacteria bacterium]